MRCFIVTGWEGKSDTDLTFRFRIEHTLAVFIWDPTSSCSCRLILICYTHNFNCTSTQISRTRRSSWGDIYTFLYLFVILVPIDWFVIMLYLSLCLVGDFQRFIETMRGIQGALIVAAGFQMLMGFLGIWRNAVRYVIHPWLKVFSMALPFGRIH